MEKRNNFQNSHLYSTLSPGWKSSLSDFKCTLRQYELSNSQTIKTTRKTELEKYKLKLNQKSRQSPIVKACKNVDEFYRSIKPLKSKFTSFKCAGKGMSGKPNLLMSFYSGDSHEELPMMSQVVNLQSLERLKDMTNEFTVKQEDEMYRETLKGLCDNLNIVFYGKSLEKKESEDSLKESSFSI